jgi:hypothetical protein
MRKQIHANPGLPPHMTGGFPRLGIGPGATMLAL